ncbi:MAG: 6,7-dimethyl-8-ribityllumazine synthase [Bacteroidetes bacterium]|nr:6,7-dimethyl-8-ribityllumazine synthase [Bacteroidota bacterium]
MDVSIPIRELQGDLAQPSDTEFGVAVSRYYKDIANGLLEGCLDALKQNSVEHIDLVWCPGAFELPQTVQHMIINNNYSAVIALGTVIRGETFHFELISQSCFDALQEIAIRSGIVVTVGVLTTDTVDQATERSKMGPKNKGREAALAALEMVSLGRLITGNGESR